MFECCSSLLLLLLLLTAPPAGLYREQGWCEDAEAAAAAHSRAATDAMHNLVGKQHTTHVAHALTRTQPLNTAPACGRRKRPIY